jgi:hypothetical protein
MVSGAKVRSLVFICKNVLTVFQNDNTPAIVSLAAGGIAGAVEGFLSVRIGNPDRGRSRVTDLNIVSFGIRKD